MKNIKGFGGSQKPKKKRDLKQKNKFAEGHLISEAFKFHSQGNISEAAKYYQLFIDKGFADPIVFLNYGTIYKQMGKPERAIELYKKAIALNPENADAHSNMGNILRDIGKLKEAEVSTRKAIELNPNNAIAQSNLGNILRDIGHLEEAEFHTLKAIKLNPDNEKYYLNLGNIMSDLGRLEEAKVSTQKAIKLNPNYAEAHSNLGSILSDLGKLEEAKVITQKAIDLNQDNGIAHSNLGGILKNLGETEEAFNYYLKAIEINPKLSENYSYITEFLGNCDASRLNKFKLKNILHLLLERDDITHNNLFRSFNFLYGNELERNLKDIDMNFSKDESFKFLITDELIINALKKIIFTDIRLEKSFTKIRRIICNSFTRDSEVVNYSLLKFIIALGEQCFLNEYVYSMTEEENISINNIINKYRDGELNEIIISILSCYFPLYKLVDRLPLLKSFNSSNESFKGLIKLQISEPLEEIKFSHQIRQLGIIKDDVSKQVKSQYEENPYPRWRYGFTSKHQKNTINQIINNEINPNSISQNIVNKHLKVLIAGCGTGQHILHTQRYKNDQVTGIDLSLSSLSYAKRKLKELGIYNIELIQMDILQVDLIEEKFDIIESSGVLHHMDDPLKGLKALLGVLKNNGFLKLGLYSELARQDIIKARRYIRKTKLQPNVNDIRDFRQKVASGELDELSSLKSIEDFYSLSQCRDLCFHAKEHRLNITQLRKALETNQLNFLGFLLPQRVKSLYKKYFPKDKTQTNLQNWSIFEEKYPNTFIGMYQFWVYKK